MGYECQNFKNGQVLTADCLNKMEQGILDAFGAVPPACDDKDCSKVLSYGENGFEWIPLPDVTDRMDNTLVLKDGIMGVNVTSEVAEDNTLPVSSAAVYGVLGNVEVLLERI